MQIEVDFDTKPIINYFDRIGNRKNIKKAVAKALAKCGIYIKRAVTPKTPRGTGELLNNWKVETNELTIELGFNIVYAMYQHQGRRQDGSYVIINRPAGGETYFLKNAIEENYNYIMQLFTDTLAQELLKP